MGKLKVKTEPVPVAKRKCDGACGVHNKCIGDIHRFFEAAIKLAKQWGIYGPDWQRDM